MKTKKLTCEYCGIKSKKVLEVPNPYLMEIEDKIVIQKICPKCHEEIADDI